jgi:hypothetical protein
VPPPPVIPTDQPIQSIAAAEPTLTSKPSKMVVINKRRMKPRWSARLNIAEPMAQYCCASATSDGIRGRPMPAPVGHVVGVYTLDSDSLSRTQSIRHFAPIAYELSWLNFDACTLRLGEQVSIPRQSRGLY